VGPFFARSGLNSSIAIITSNCCWLLKGFRCEAMSRCGRHWAISLLSWRPVGVNWSRLLLGSRIAGRYAELARLPFNFYGEGSFGSFVWATDRAELLDLSMFS
jgi:hypothetical protein